jgi:type IV pilus assembly protein PilQ
MTRAASIAAALLSAFTSLSGCAHASAPSRLETLLLPPDSRCAQPAAKAPVPIPPPVVAAAPKPATTRDGKRLDISAKDLEVTQFLEAMSEVGRINIVASDNVQGKITLRLRNVTWREALDAVLKLKGLGMEELSGNVYRVAPQTVLEAELAAREHEDG